MGDSIDERYHCRHFIRGRSDRIDSGLSLIHIFLKEQLALGEFEGKRTRPHLPLRAKRGRAAAVQQERQVVLMRTGQAAFRRQLRGSVGVNMRGKLLLDLLCVRERVDVYKRQP